MRLLDDLYRITDRADSSFTVSLNPEHFIYRAHFPGEPVTPGVVILQISVEILEVVLGLPLQLSTARNVKFLRVINPLQTPSVTYSCRKLEVEGDEIKAQIAVTGGEDIYAKLSIVCRRK